MSKSWRQPKWHTSTPQAAIDRLRMLDAKSEIREALKASQEVSRGQ
jgi:hypothetical protein